MDSVNQDERLSRITTLWTMLQRAHAAPEEGAAQAQAQLMERYCGAVYRYLLGALRNEDAALELFQEFALRFLRGDFRRADPRRGRFRDYVRTALIHLVTDYHRARGAWPRPLPTNVAGSDGVEEDAAFVDSWREELVNRAWEALRAASPAYHAALALHAEQPDLAAADLAAELTRQADKPITAGHVRVILHRAREKFSELLLEEVAHSLEAPSDAELVEELRQLRMLKLCAASLARRSGDASKS